MSRILMLVIVTFLAVPVGWSSAQDGPLTGAPVGANAEPEWDPPVAGEPVYNEPEWDPPVAGEPVYGEPTGGEAIGGAPVGGAPVQDPPAGGEPLN